MLGNMVWVHLEPPPCKKKYFSSPSLWVCQSLDLLLLLQQVFLARKQLCECACNTHTLPVVHSAMGPSGKWLLAQILHGVTSMQNSNAAWTQEWMPCVYYDASPAEVYGLASKYKASIHVHARFKMGLGVPHLKFKPTVTCEAAPYNVVEEASLGRST